MARVIDSSAFAEFARARTVSLYRSAILLTHEDHTAQELAARALGKASLRWEQAGSAPEAFVREIMLRDFVQNFDSAEFSPDAVAREVANDSSGRVALGDPLSGLSARQRAIVVLRHAHDQSLAQSARTLGVRERVSSAEAARGAELLPGGDLRAALRDVAESFAPPDAEVVLARAREYARHGRVRGSLRLGALAASAVLVLVVAAVLTGPDPATEEDVESAVVKADYSGGYGLVGGAPQPFVDGLELISTEVIDYSLRRRTIAAPDVAEQTQVYAVAYCDLPGNAMDVDAILNAITLEAGDSIVDLSCQDRNADLSTSPLISALPRGVQEYAVTVPTVWSGTGEVNLSFYTEADWSTYPFPVFAGTLESGPGFESGPVIDPSTPLTPAPNLDWLLDADQEVRSIDVEVNTTVEITALTTEPGQLLVALDGVVITNDGEELTALGRSRPGPWEVADPALRQGFWRGYSASGYHRYLDSGMLSALGVDITDDAVTVSVIARGFNADGWQVITTTDGGNAPMALAPGYDSTLPLFAHGMRRVAAYEVPTDGQPHAAPLPVDLAERMTWIGACSVETPHQIRTVTLLTPTRYGLIPCASYRSEWASPLTPVSAGVPRSEGQADLDDRQGVTLTTPRTSERTSLTIAAYEDVPYADFPFEATEQPSTTQLNLRPVPDEGDLVGMITSSNTLRSWTRADVLTDADIDPQGRGTLRVPPGMHTLLSISTEGKGRLSIRPVDAPQEPLDGMFIDPSVFGRVASPLMYRQGWWTSWTVQPSQWTIPVPVGLDTSGATLEVRVQGYDPGSLRIVVLEAAPTDDTLNQ